MKPSISDKPRILSMLQYVVKQGDFIQASTDHMRSFQDFLMSMDQVILFNSTCMCLQTIGETLRKVDKLTNGEWLSSVYPAIPWRSVFGLRNIISHEYASTDPEEIFNIVREDLPELLSVVRKIIQDLA